MFHVKHLTFVPKEKLVYIGYDISWDGGGGSIFIRERGGQYFLHGFSTGGITEFFIAMRVILAEFDKKNGGFLAISRTATRNDIGSAYARFGFSFLGEYDGKKVYLRKPNHCVSSEIMEK